MNEPLFGSVSPWGAEPFPPTAGSVSAAVGGMPLGVRIPSFLRSDVPVPAFLATVAVRRGQPLGPSNDQEIEDFLYDALELIPGSGEVEVRCDGGRVAFTGAVPNKRLKRDVGEIAWAIPNVTDVQNTITITARRRSRAGAQGEPQVAVGRKSA